MYDSVDVADDHTTIAPQLRVLPPATQTAPRPWYDKIVLFYRPNNVLTPLIATLKPQSNGPPYSNTVIGTLAVDGWAVTFGTARRGLDGVAARPGPS